MRPRESFPQSLMHYGVDVAVGWHELKARNISHPDIYRKADGLNVLTALAAGTGIGTVLIYGTMATIQPDLAFPQMLEVLALTDTISLSWLFAKVGRDMRLGEER